jgi:hypothetical protein
MREIQDGDSMKLFSFGKHGDDVFHSSLPGFFFFGCL